MADRMTARKADLPDWSRSNLHTVTAKGRTYHYHRITREPLSDDEAARVLRLAEINATIKSRAPQPRAAPGSLDELIQAFRGSSDFRVLSDNTKRDYLSYFDWLSKAYGKNSLDQITLAMVLSMRDGLADRPRKANYIVAVLRRLYSFAAQRGIADHNPLLNIKPLKTGPGYRAWPDVAVARFRAKAPERLVWAMELGLYTGQRLGDVLAMQWSHYKDGLISVVQGKTGARLVVPVHCHLAGVLARMPRDNLMMLTTLIGKPWDRDGLSTIFGRALKACELSGLVYHGLRHTAGSNLAEAGCTDREIMAILGHRSVAMVTRYTRGAEQERLARSAILKLERNR